MPRNTHQHYIICSNDVKEKRTECWSLAVATTLSKAELGFYWDELLGKTSHVSPWKETDYGGTGSQRPQVWELHFVTCLFQNSLSVSRGAHISHQELGANCIIEAQIEVQIIPFCRKYFHWFYIALLSGVEKYSLVWQGRPRKTWWNPLLVLILIIYSPPLLHYSTFSGVPSHSSTAQSVYYFNFLLIFPS